MVWCNKVLIVDLQKVQLFFVLKYDNEIFSQTIKPYWCLSVGEWRKIILSSLFYHTVRSVQFNTIPFPKMFLGSAPWL